MIPVSAHFAAMRRGGAYPLQTRVQLFLPANPAAVTASTAAANFPAAAVIDGDRTHLNAGVANGLYPPPAGPENFIGNGIWQPSAGAPQSVTLTMNGQPVGRVVIYTHPTAGGVKAFKLQTADLIGGPYTDVTAIDGVTAWEKYNGRSTVVVAAPTITVTPVNTNRTSIPSVFDVTLTGNIATNFLRVVVTDFGTTATNFGIAEIEVSKLVDVSALVSDVEASHSTDVTLRGITARQVQATFANPALAVSPADFRRASSGQASIDLQAEFVVMAGIDNEYVTLGRFSVDTAEFDHANRSVKITGRQKSERVMFERPAAAYRRNVRLDDMSSLLYPIMNLPEGLTAVETDPQELNVFAPGAGGRQELENVRRAAADRGVYVDTDGVLRSLAGSVYGACQPELAEPPPALVGLGHLLCDAIFFDPADARKLIFLYENDSSPARLDNLKLWDTTKLFATRTTLVQVFGGVTDVTPNIMARRPSTNDFWFLSGAGSDAGAKLRGFTINAGVATPLIANQNIAHLALSATFIGNFMYWSECSNNTNPDSRITGANTGVLKKWDVTTAFAPVLVGNEAARIRGMAAIGTDLYYGLDDGTLVKFPTGGAFGSRTNLGTIFTSFSSPEAIPAAARRIVADGNNLWMIGDYVGLTLLSVATGALASRWDTTAAFSTRAFPANPVSPGSALVVVGGVGLFHSRSAVLNSAGGIAAMTNFTVERWDGVNGSNTTTVVYTPEGTNGAAGRGMVASPSTWFGKRPLYVMEYLVQDGRRQSFIDYVLYQDTSTPAETLTESQVDTVAESASYELGGAGSAVTAVTGTVTQYTEAVSQTVYRTDVVNVGVCELSSTADPTTFAGAFFAFIRRHCRFPRFATGVGTSIQATVASVLSSVQFMASLPVNASLDPNLMSKIDASSPYATNVGVAKTMTGRALVEGAAAFRWLRIEMILFPEVELADLIALNVNQPTNAGLLTVTGTFRVLAVSHRISAAADGAEARTTLELVSVA